MKSSNFIILSIIVLLILILYKTTVQAQASGEVFPNQFIVSGENGQSITRTFTIQAKADIHKIQILLPDLEAADGLAILPSHSIQSQIPEGID